MAPSDRPDCSCGSLDDSPHSPDSQDGFPVIVEHSEEGECLETSRMLEMRRTGVPGGSGDCHDVHRRNLTSVASPVILMFDGFHNLVYHIYLATRWGGLVPFRLFMMISLSYAADISCQWPFCCSDSLFQKS